MLRELRNRNGVAVFTALAMCSISAGAADLVNLSVEIDGWTMMPIAENGATSHIIATRNDDEILTTDIDVVLYARTATGWSGSAYDPSVTKEDAMIDIANEFGLPDPFDGEWHIDLDAIDVLDHVLPRVSFGKGFFVSDPMYIIANQIEDPEPLAEAAESTGLAAGSGAVNTNSISGGAAGGQIGGGIPLDCDCDACLQDGISVIADLFLSDPSFTLDDAVAIAESTEAFICVCHFSLRRVTTPSAWSSWACGAWGQPTPDPVTGKCEFSTTSSRFKTRTYTKFCYSCITGVTTSTTTQFCTESGTLSLSLNPDVNGNCVAPSGCGAPNNGVTRTGWTPPPPACPFP